MYVALTVSYASLGPTPIMVTPNVILNINTVAITISWQICMYIE